MVATLRRAALIGQQLRPLDPYRDWQAPATTGRIAADWFSEGSYTPSPLTPYLLGWEALAYAGDTGAGNLAEGEAVAWWRDSSGNERRTAQSTVAARPVFRRSVAALNNKPAFQLDGTGDFLVTSSFTDIPPSFASRTQPFSVVVVFVPTTLDATNRDVMGTDGLSVTVNNSNTYLYAGGASSVDRGSAVTLNAASVIIAEVDGASSSLTVNGDAAITGTLGGGTANQLALGCYNSASSSNFFAGYIAFAGIIAGHISSDPYYSALLWWLNIEYGVTVPSTGLSATIGQVFEIDTVQALSRAKAKLIGQSLETDLSQALVRRKIRLVGQPVETDLAQLLGRRKTRTLGQTSETDTAQAMTRLAALGGIVGQTTETDLSQALGRVKRKLTGQPVETDTAGALGRIKTRLLGLVTETDLAQTATRRKTKTIGQPVETDTAQTTARAKRATAGQATETDSAQTVTRRTSLGGPIGQNLEVDFSQALTRVKRKTLGQATEADSAQAATRRKTRTLGQSSETDLAQPAGRVKRKTLGQTLEVDTTTGVTRAKRRTIGQPVETDVAQPATARRLRVVLIGQAAELDTAQPMAVTGLPILGFIDVGAPALGWDIDQPARVLAAGRVVAGWEIDSTTTATTVGAPSVRTMP